MAAIQTHPHIKEITKNTRACHPQRPARHDLHKKNKPVSNNLQLGPSMHDLFSPDLLLLSYIQNCCIPMQEKTKIKRTGKKVVSPFSISWALSVDEGSKSFVFGGWCLGGALLFVVDGCASRLYLAPPIISALASAKRCPTRSECFKNLSAHLLMQPSYKQHRELGEKREIKVVINVCLVP